MIVMPPQILVPTYKRTPAAGGGGGSPPATSAMVAWYRGDSLVNDGSGKASSWNDKTANAHTLSQATSGNRPSIIANGYGSQTVARFSGGAQVLYTNSGFSTSQPFTVVIIAKLTDDAAGFWVVGGDVTGDAYAVWMDDTNFGMSAGGLDVIGAFGGSKTAWHIHQAEFNGSSSARYDNGSSIATGTLGSNGLFNVAIGASVSYGLGWSGDIAEAIYYNRVLTSQERTDLSAYVASYYV